MSEEQSYSDTGHRSFDGIHALKAVPESTGQAVDSHLLCLQSPNVEQDSARENDEQRRNVIRVGWTKQTLSFF